MLVLQNMGEIVYTESGQIWERCHICECFKIISQDGLAVCKCDLQKRIDEIVQHIDDFFDGLG